MNETVTLFLAWLAGGALGAIFFGGLWWTVRKGVSSQRPAVWFLVSLTLRLSIVLTGFYNISGGRFERLAVSLFGFIVARLVVTWLAGPPIENLTSPAKEVRHAP